LAKEIGRWEVESWSYALLSILFVSAKLIQPSLEDTSDRCMGLNTTSCQQHLSTLIKFDSWRGIKLVNAP